MTQSTAAAGTPAQAGGGSENASGHSESSKRVSRPRDRDRPLAMPASTGCETAWWIQGGAIVAILGGFIAIAAALKLL